MIACNLTKQELEQSLRIRRDSCQVLREKLKRENDNYGLSVILISTLSASMETTKLSLELDSKYLDLSTIFLASACSLIISYQRYKDLQSRCENLVRVSETLTGVLKELRDSPTITTDLIQLYNQSCAQVENILPPDERKKYFAQSETGIVKITTDELKFKKKLATVHEKHELKRDIESGNSTGIVLYDSNPDKDEDNESIA